MTNARWRQTGHICAGICLLAATLGGWMAWKGLHPARGIFGIALLAYFAGVYHGALFITKKEE